MEIEKILNSNPYVMSDCHFLHRNITRLTNRPVDWETTLVSNWNSTIKEDDYVVILGDLFMGTKKYIRLFMNKAELKGKIILLVGNHDGYSDNFYASLGIQTIRNYIENNTALRNAVVWRNIILSHYPFVPIPDSKCNLHGHVHNSIFNGREGRHINVCVEMLDYKIIRLEDLINADKC